MGIELSLEDWQRVGENIPLIVNCMPAGKYLGEGFHRAGGVPAVLHELQKLVYYTKIVHRLAVKQWGNCQNAKPQMRMSFSLMINLLNMVLVSLCSVAIFDSAIMKMSVVGEAFKTYLSDPNNENSFEARAIVLKVPKTITHVSMTLP